MSKKVTLFFPSYASGEASPPLALISLAAPLLAHGIEVVIVDQSLENNCTARLLRECEDSLCLGISVVTGPMIKGAVEAGRRVKEAYPNLPIILGGWHPSTLPEQTLKADFVDIVVVKQGEMALLEIVEAIRTRSSLDQVAGILWKEGEQIHRNDPRAYLPVKDLSSRVPGYGLIDYSAYEARTGLRWIMYSTSHGCPYNCSYCSNASVYGRKLDLLPVEQVVDEVTFLVKKYGIKLVGIIDDIFFAFMDRSLEIAEGFLRTGVQFEWYIQDRLDSWARLTEREARLYRRAGLVRVHFGAESGSDKVLRSIEKRSRVESTELALERCAAADIRASLGFIFGLPEETEKDLRMTLSLIDEVHRRYEKVDCYTNIFTPYPGSPLWPVAIEKGFEPPGTFEEWAAFYPRETRLAWLTDSEHERLQVIRQYLRFGYHQVKVGERPFGLKHRALLRLFQPTSRLRVRNGWFSLPWEVAGYRALIRLNQGFTVQERF